MTDKAYAVPLHELLAHVPRGARLEITDPDGMGTRFIPVGRYCHEASEALRARLSQPEPAECDGGQCGIGGYCKQCPKTQPDVPETTFGETKPVLYQVRGRPNWDTEPKWGEWKFCTEPVANDYIKTPALHDWEYQVRSLYTTPPQREWVGLTDDEIDSALRVYNSFGGRLDARKIEAKLKEKNT